MKPTQYDRNFYNRNLGGSSTSAAEIVPYIISIVRPNSVVDVGCGMGTWAAEFLRLGIRSVLGIDGAYVGAAGLQIPASSFLPADLEARLNVDRIFDLGISMEVAEHLSPDRATSFVQDLTRLAPVVLFSAAVPTQMGTNHINEQWPTYWARLFSQYRYRTIDCLRARFWNNERIEYWYRQNMFLYVREDRAGEFERLAVSGPMDIVHPEMLAWQQKSPECLVRSVPLVLRHSASRLLRKA